MCQILRSQKESPLPENEKVGVKTVDKDSDDATVCLSGVASSGVSVLSGSYVWVYWMLHCCWILCHLCF